MANIFFSVRSLISYSGSWKAPESCAHVCKLGAKVFKLFYCLPATAHFPAVGEETAVRSGSWRRLYGWAGPCLLRAWASENRASVYALVNIWVMLVPTNCCCRDRICGGFAMWRLDWLNSSSQIPSAVCFWLEWAPTETPVGDLQSASELWLLWGSYSQLLICWLTWLMGGSDQACNSPILGWILLWHLGQVCLFSPRTKPRLLQDTPHQDQKHPHGPASPCPLELQLVLAVPQLTSTFPSWPPPLRISHPGVKCQDNQLPWRIRSNPCKNPFPYL